MTCWFLLVPSALPVLVSLLVSSFCPQERGSVPSCFAASSWFRLRFRCLSPFFSLLWFRCLSPFFSLLSSSGKGFCSIMICWFFLVPAGVPVLVSLILSSLVPVLVSLLFSSFFPQDRGSVPSRLAGSSWFRLGFRCLSPFFSLLSFLRKGVLFHHDLLVPLGSGGVPVLVSLLLTSLVPVLVSLLLCCFFPQEIRHPLCFSLCLPLCFPLCLQFVSNFVPDCVFHFVSHFVSTLFANLSLAFVSSVYPLLSSCWPPPRFVSHFVSPCVSIFVPRFVSQLFATLSLHLVSHHVTHFVSFRVSRFVFFSRFVSSFVPHFVSNFVSRCVAHIVCLIASALRVKMWPRHGRYPEPSHFEIWNPHTIPMFSLPT